MAAPRSLDGLYLNQAQHSPRRQGSFYYTVFEMQGVQGTNRGEEVNNRIFSRKMCGGSNCNGSFVKQFVDGDRVLHAARSERLSMDRTGADVFTRTQSLQPVPSPPRRLKELSRKPSLPLPYAAHSPATRMLLDSQQLEEDKLRRPDTASSFMSVSGTSSRLLPAMNRRLSP